MEQERKPRDKRCINGYLTIDRAGKNIQWEKIFSSINAAGKTGQLHEKNETRTPPNTIHKDKVKMD